MARALTDAMADGREPRVTGAWRAGDVRHVFASAALAQKRLGFTAREPFESGMREFATAPLRA
jgi:dTDP-L-rhamnose 4-epimerase